MLKRQTSSIRTTSIETKLNSSKFSFFRWHVRSNKLVLVLLKMFIDHSRSFEIQKVSAEESHKEKVQSKREKAPKSSLCTATPSLHPLEQKRPLPDCFCFCFVLFFYFFEGRGRPPTIDLYQLRLFAFTCRSYFQWVSGSFSDLFLPLPTVIVFTSSWKKSPLTIHSVVDLSEADNANLIISPIYHSWSW